MYYINQYKAYNTIMQTQGQIFSATFTKKDGTLRKMIARLGVRKDLKGGTNHVTPQSSYVTVYDMHKKAYRLINLDTLINISANHKKYLVKKGK